MIAAHPEQGWSLLCNGVIVFDDTGAIAAGAHRPATARRYRPSRIVRVISQQYSGDNGR